MSIFNHLISDIFFFRRADQVLVGDQLLIPRSNELSLAKVMNISYFKMQGTLIFFFAQNM